MQKANEILQALQKLGKQQLPLTRIYRMLYSEELYLIAYNKLSAFRSCHDVISDDYFHKSCMLLKMIS